jgi:hypothetical protein
MACTMPREERHVAAGQCERCEGNGTRGRPALDAFRHDDGTVSVATTWTFAEPEAAIRACVTVADWYAAVAIADAVGFPQDAGESPTTVVEGDRDALALDCQDTEVAFTLGPTPSVATHTLGQRVSQGRPAGSG